MELLVVIAVIGVLLAILLPATERARHKGYITACGSNLHQLGQSLTIYANDNRGAYPRTSYDPAMSPTAGTGVAASDPFAVGGPQANDMSAAVWLLLRAEKLPTSLVICPYDDVNEFEADKAVVANQSNFTNYKKNLGYSYANPYPDKSANERGYRLAAKVSPAFAVMADINPGISPVHKADIYAPRPGAAASVMRLGNSGNHESEGQNVLYGDGHVEYQITPLCGVNGDNIYTGQTAISPATFVSPATKDDSVLLPTD